MSWISSANPSWLNAVEFTATILVLPVFVIGPTLGVLWIDRRYGGRIAAAVAIFICGAILMTLGWNLH